jgi:hypothetical protein
MIFFKISLKASFNKDTTKMKEKDRKKFAQLNMGCKNLFLFLGMIERKITFLNQKFTIKNSKIINFSLG